MQYAHNQTHAGTSYRAMRRQARSAEVLCVCILSVSTVHRPLTCHLRPLSAVSAPAATTAPAPGPSKAAKIVSDMKAAESGTLTGAKRPPPGRQDGGGVKRKPDDTAAMVAKRAKLESVPSPQVAK